MVSPSLRLPGRQAQRPQHLMVALLATHPLLSAGASGGPLRACTACGHYCTGTLVLPKGVTSHPALPRGDPEPHMVLGVLGPSTRNPSQGTRADQQSLCACIRRGLQAPTMVQHKRLLPGPVSQPFRATARPLTFHSSASCVEAVWLVRAWRSGRSPPSSKDTGGQGPSEGVPGGSSSLPALLWELPSTSFLDSSAQGRRDFSNAAQVFFSLHNFPHSKPSILFDLLGGRPVTDSNSPCRSCWL